MELSYVLANPEQIAPQLYGAGKKLGARIERKNGGIV